MKQITIKVILLFLLFVSCNSGNSSDKKVMVVASDTATVKYCCPMQCEGDTCYTTAGVCLVCEMDLEKN